MNLPRFALRAVTAFALLMLYAWLGWMVAGMRTMQFGPSLRLYVVAGAIVFVLTFLILAAVHLPGSYRRLAGQAAMATLALLMCVEAYASLQERQLQKKYGKECTERVYEPRWHPYSNSVIFCVDGVWGGND